MLVIRCIVVIQSWQLWSLSKLTSCLGHRLRRHRRSTGWIPMGTTSHRIFHLKAEHHILWRFTVWSKSLHSFRSKLRNPSRKAGAWLVWAIFVEWESLWILVGTRPKLPSILFAFDRCQRASLRCRCTPSVRTKIQGRMSFWTLQKPKRPKAQTMGNWRPEEIFDQPLLLIWTYRKSHQSINFDPQHPQVLILW